jgi:hypothetical protein
MPATLTPAEIAENMRHAQEMKERVATLVDELASQGEYLDSIDGWRGIVLRRFFQRWNEHEEANDAYWHAAGEFLAADSADTRHGSGFDDGLRAATIKLMIAADHATGDQAESDGELFLKISTFRELETAHEQIGKELDRIRREA